LAWKYGSAGLEMSRFPVFFAIICFIPSTLPMVTIFQLERYCCEIDVLPDIIAAFF